MKADWQQFRRKKAAPAMVISLNKHGEIAFNSVAWKSVYRPVRLNLFFDAAGRRIGFKRCFLDAADDAFRVTRRPGRKSYSVRAKRFMREFAIEISDTVRFMPPDETKDGMWILDLNTAFVPEKVKGNHWNKRRKEK